MGNVGFCLKCSKYVPCSIKSRPDSFTRKDVDVNYTELFAVCDNCGSEVYLPEVNDINVGTRDRAYRAAYSQKHL